MASPSHPSAPSERASTRPEWLLIPNIISFFRMVMIVPIAVLYPSGEPGNFRLMVALLLVAYLSDYADGFMARKLNQQSRLGLILDPLADKLWTAAMLILMAGFRDFPIWMLLVLVGRDVLIMSINLRCLRLTGSAMASDEVGRKYLVVLGLMIIGVTLRIGAAIWLAYPMVVLAAVTLYRYYRNYTRAVAAFQQNGMQTV